MLNIHTFIHGKLSCVIITDKLRIHFVSLRTQDIFALLVPFQILPKLYLHIPFLKAFPESPRYLMASGQVDEALKTLQEVAKCNKTTLPRGELIREPEVSKKNRN